MPEALSPQRNPYLCALLTGLLLVLAFPDFSLNLLGWVALVPLFVMCVRRQGRGRLFLSSYFAGGVFFAGSCYWIYLVMRNYGGLSRLASAWVFLLFVLVFGLFFAVFGLLAGELASRWREHALFLFPFLWVALEWARAHVPFGGFPWNLLGYTVASHPGWVQLATYSGVYGLSFLVAAVNAAVAACWLSPDRRRVVLVTAITVMLTAAAFAGQRLPSMGTPETAVLVQTNLPQMTAPDPDWRRHHPEKLEEFDNLTRDAVLESNPQRTPLVVWPEVPAPFYFHRDPVLRARFAGLAQNSGAYFLTGIVDFRIDAENPGDERLHPYNSAILLAPDGAIAGQYDKIHLVPFGEYLPWANLLGLAESLVQEVSAFRPGHSYAVLPAGRERISVLICYEAIFPDLVREFADRGATVLVNISNDGWFGRSSAAAQHLNMARVRAVETRRFLLRATNTGVTAVVDPYGRILAQAPAGERTVLTAGFAYQRGKTAYVRFGDWFPALCVMLAVAALMRKYWMQATEVNT